MNGVPFYAGAGGHGRSVQRRRSTAWKAKVDSNGSKYIINILYKGTCFNTARDLEQDQFDKYGLVKDGGLLINENRNKLTKPSTRIKQKNGVKTERSGSSNGMHNNLEAHLRISETKRKRSWNKYSELIIEISKTSVFKHGITFNYLADKYRVNTVKVSGLRRQISEGRFDDFLNE
jgi:hypothetical protein